MIKRREVGPRHLVIPDTQVKPGAPIDHLRWLGRYIADKRPNRVIHLGDNWDMPSLSSYDKGKKSAEGRRYKADVDAGNEGFGALRGEVKRYAPRSYDPTWDFMFGNHEERIQRHVEANPELEGQIGYHNLNLSGWRVHEFLRPTTIDGVTYMHYCPLNAQGRVSASRFGAPSARTQAQRMMRSTVCGHRQGLDTAVIQTPGRTIRGVIAGSFYQHEEAYLTACGETYWRGVLVLNDVRPDTGEFDICEVSMSYLERRYG